MIEDDGYVTLTKSDYEKLVKIASARERMTVNELLKYLDPRVYIEVKYQGRDGATFAKYRGKADKYPEQYLRWEVCGVTAEMNKIIVYVE